MVCEIWRKQAFIWKKLLKKLGAGGRSDPAMVGLHLAQLADTLYAKPAARSVKGRWPLPRPVARDAMLYWRDVWAATGARRHHLGRDDASAA